MRYWCGICRYKLQRNRFGSLYCSRGYSQNENCECRKARGKENVYDEKVLFYLKESLKRVMDEEEMKLQAKVTDEVNTNLISSLEKDLRVARSFLALDSMTDEMWEKFVKDVYVYPGERLDIRWNFDM